MDPGTWVGFGGLAITLLGIVYQSGRLSARVETLEKWQSETAGDIKAILSAVGNISGAIGARKIP